MDEKKISEFQKIIDESNKIVFFGGAGVSTESGIPDFRSTSGLYRQQWKYPPETIVSSTFFYNNTAEFYRFYCQKMIALDAEPNECHKKLAELEVKGKLSAVVTQNIDGLHQKAGSKTVYELHGSVLRNHCTNPACHAFYDAQFILDEHANLAKKTGDGVPLCKKCGSLVKPDVVLYEEGLDEKIIGGAVKAISEADTLIIGGTSLVVYPAAGLVRYFSGKNLVIINLSPTDYDRNADLLLEEKIGEVFSRIKV